MGLVSGIRHPMYVEEEIVYHISYRDFVPGSYKGPPSLRPRPLNCPNHSTPFPKSGYGPTIGQSFVSTDKYFPPWKVSQPVGMMVWTLRLFMAALAYAWNAIIYSAAVLRFF